MLCYLYNVKFEAACLVSVYKFRFPQTRKTPRSTRSSSWRTSRTATCRRSWSLCTPARWTYPRSSCPRSWKPPIDWKWRASQRPPRISNGRAKRRHRCPRCARLQTERKQQHTRRHVEQCVALARGKLFPLAESTILYTHTHRRYWKAKRKLRTQFYWHDTLTSWQFLRENKLFFWNR